jgi:TetR/AcrR family transcriptional regulator
MRSSAARPASQQSRREVILAAAEVVFAEKGYDGARLDDVARRVGIRRASLLYHFADKDALYEAVLDSLTDDLASRYRRVLSARAPAGVRLEQTIDEWLDVITARPALVRIMVREVAELSTEHSRKFAVRAAAVLSTVGEVIAAGQADQTLRRMSAPHVMMILTGASAFLTLGGSLLGGGAADGVAMIVDRAQHRELLLTMYRKLLGTNGPRPGTRKSKHVG